MSPSRGEGLRGCKRGLAKAGLDARFFAWPPENDPDRPPYRGLRPLEAEDAGIFFGREAPIVEALDRLRGLREAAPPRLLVILGASGAGKSSFLRAGLLPRLARDDRNFLPLPISPAGARGAVSGETGLMRAWKRRLQGRDRPDRASARARSRRGRGRRCQPAAAARQARRRSAAATLDGEQRAKPPTLVLPIDQARGAVPRRGREEARPSRPAARPCRRPTRRT